MGIDTNISTQTYIPPIGAGTTGGTTGATGVTSTTATGTELDTQAVLAGLNSLPGGQGASQVDGLPIPVGSSSMQGVLGSLDNDTVSADMYSFMALFQKMAQSMRDTARIDRGVQLQANVTAMTNAAEQMKETAALRFAAGVAQGAMQIAGGMMQIGMSSASMGNTLKGANLDAKGNNTLANPGASLGAKTTANSNIELGKGATGQGAAQMAYGQALSGTAQGVGGIISSGLNYAADLSDAEKAKFDIAAKVADTGMQHASDMMQQMMDVIRDVRDKLQSIQQAAVETNRGIARNI